MNESRATYLKEFEILSRSSIGVVLTHAREPHRVTTALHDWADSKADKRWFYKEWNCRDGWREWALPENGKVEKSPTSDGIVESTKALMKIAQRDEEGLLVWPTGVFVMIYPHWTINKSPIFMQTLKFFAQEFHHTQQRLVLVVPEYYTLPPELENDVVTLDLELPTKEELRRVYDIPIRAALKNIRSKATVFNEEQVDEILSIGAGMTESEFGNSVARAIISNVESFPTIPLHDFTKVIMDAKIAVVKRSEVLEVETSIDPQNVGGLDLYTGWTGERKPCFTKEFREFCGNKDFPKGCSLIGPPGTGKTLLGRVTAHILGVPFFIFKVDRVFQKHIGESESRVNAALKLLERMAPCVVLFDEVDKAGFGGGSGDGGTRDRVMGAILKFMQDSIAPIFWILTANRIYDDHGNTLIPAEMLRKGRLDEVFSIQPPNEIERLEIIKIHLRLRNQDAKKARNLDAAVKASEGFVSAEIESAIKEAVVKSFNSGRPVTGDMIADQLKTMKPLSIAFKSQFDAMLQWSKDNARLASTPTIRTRTRNVTPERNMDLVS